MPQIFKQEAKPTCLIWPKEKSNEIIFGLNNGEIKTGLIKENSIKSLFIYESSCVSISSFLDGKFIITNHEKFFILIFDTEKIHMENYVYIFVFQLT